MLGDDSIVVDSMIGSRLTTLALGAVTPCVGAPCCRHECDKLLQSDQYCYNRYHSVLGILMSFLVMSIITPWTHAGGFV